MNRQPRLPLLAAVLAASLLTVNALGQEGIKNVLAYRGEPPARAAHGMVVSVHHLAADAGLEALRQGGNAVDAAVATGFALAVVHPLAGNLGGGGFLLLRTHDGKVTFIDFREKAPAGGDRDHVPRREGKRDSGCERDRIPVDRDTRIGGGAGWCMPNAIRQAGAGKGDGSQIRLAAEIELSAEEAQELGDPGSCALCRFEADFSAWRQFVQGRREVQAAGTGANAGAHRGRPRGFLSRQDGARACG